MQSATMDSSSSSAVLGHTPTDWTLLHLAHAAVPAEAREHWARLLTIYDEPVRRALRQLVHDRDLADELNQEFWHRFLRGDFAHARPDRGRFRNLLKTALYHLVVDHYRRVRRESTLLDDVIDSTASLIDQFAEEHTEFWRRVLIDRALATLAAESSTSRQVCIQVLAVEVENPGLSSAEKAVELSRQLERPITPENYRQILRRTRVRFAQTLHDEVRQSLIDPNSEAIQEELAELSLLQYCAESTEEIAAFS